MTEKITYNQVNEQESSAYVNGGNEQPTVLVERSDGRITAGRLDTSTRDVEFTEDGQERVKPSVSMEKLSDEHQEYLAEKLAGMALRSDVATEIAPQPVVNKETPSTLTPTEQRYKAESEARGGRPYFPSTPPSSEQISRVAESGFDLSRQDKY